MSVYRKTLLDNEHGTVEVVAIIGEGHTVIAYDKATERMARKQYVIGDSKAAMRQARHWATQMEARVAEHRCTEEGACEHD